ncbi:MAG TPA: nitrous oxide reductase family maturation protein NosD [Gemmatimonadaceae bacterium]|nr:nitrous oxide reductase family maturation protein NosD [Gemmatimonadaceae bacterium]
MLLAFAALARVTQGQGGVAGDTARGRTIEVSPTGRVPRIGDAVRSAAPGTRILVRRGTYREPRIVIDRPGITLDGEAGAIIDGSGTHTILEIAADDVTVRGLTLRNTGPSQSEERAGILVHDVGGCRVQGNRLEETLFAIYLAKVHDCLVSDNVIRGHERAQTVSGNGVHIWSSERVQVLRNDVRGHRDGIYFEFVKRGRVVGNRSQRSARYGMHFMFSDDCRYEDNLYRDNANGIAVMYSNRVEMIGNRFEHNWGSAAYGLLLKDINDSRIEGNTFLSNSVGLYLEGANRNVVLRNAFRANGWALKTMANATGNLFERNTFEGNAFDVGTNSTSNVSRFQENYWDRYRGYDLDRNGIGDVPHAPVRLFALVVEQSPPTLLLLRSLLVDLLDLAERVIPTLTPATLLDDRPLMKRPAQDGARG